MTLDDVNAMTPERFTAAFAAVAEHSPWVAQRAAAARPFAARSAMVDAFQAAIAQASRAEQIGLLRAHPDLAGRAALAPDSAAEQAGAGLDRLSALELERLTSLNARYDSRFGFPFILAVRGATKHDVTAALERRVDGAPEEEFWTALAEVMRIVRFRIEDRVDG